MWRKIFGSTTEADVERVRKELFESNFHHREPDFVKVDPRIVLLPGHLEWLPIRLRHWEKLLLRWEEARAKTRRARRGQVARELRNTPGVELSGPHLPRGYDPWLVSVAIDPGEVRDPELGHTTLFLLAAPQDWEPAAVVPMVGRFREIECPRLDGMCIRIPEEWWEYWSTGAYADGALYFVPPRPSSDH